MYKRTTAGNQARREKITKREDSGRGEAETELKVIPLITGLVLTNHRGATANPIIAGLMVSPGGTSALPQLTIVRYEDYNGNAISRNTRGPWRKP